TITIKDDKALQNRKGTITLKPAASLSGDKNVWDEPLYRILTKVDADGIPFLACIGGNYDWMTPVSDLADDLSKFNGMNISDFVTTNCYGQIDKLALIVLPEEDAREVLAKG